ncbi:MAG: heat shock protein Hsp20 [Actinomycetia bacterium]|nr:heat shock protein Hsp20 [Actinomycetes bacterium]
MTSVMRRPNNRQQTMRWDPSPDLQSMNALMNRLFEGLGEEPAALEGAFIPAADVEETEDAFIIEVELPGVGKKDIDVAVSGRRLTITGERKEKERAGVLRRRVRNVGRFRYELILPTEVDENSVSATFDSGVLTIRVAKHSGEKLRHVEVQ